MLQLFNNYPMLLKVLLIEVVLASRELASNFILFALAWKYLVVYVLIAVYD